MNHMHDLGYITRNGRGHGHGHVHHCQTLGCDDWRGAPPVRCRSLGRVAVREGICWFCQRERTHSLLEDMEVARRTVLVSYHGLRHGEGFLLCSICRSSVSLLRLDDRQHRRSLSAKPEKVLFRPGYRGGQRRPRDEARVRQWCQERPLLQPSRVLTRLVQL